MNEMNRTLERAASEVAFELSVTLKRLPLDDRSGTHELERAATLVSMLSSLAAAASTLQGGAQ